MDNFVTWTIALDFSIHTLYKWLKLVIESCNKQIYLQVLFNHLIENPVKRAQYVFFLAFDWCLVYCRYQLASYDIKSNGFKEIYTHACKKHNLMRSKDIGYHIIQMYRSKKYARCTYNSTPNLTLDQWKIVTPKKNHHWKKSSLKNIQGLRGPRNLGWTFFWWGNIVFVLAFVFVCVIVITRW